MTKYKINAFTIVELLVAMALLVMLLGLSSAVFSYSVRAHRTAGSTVEIARSLRVVTDQLNADFQGLRKEAPVFIGFNRIDTDADGTADSNFDMIHFFADGDFQTTKQYNGGTVYGNIARVFYGHANGSTGTNYTTLQLLARKSHILSADAGLLTMYGEIPAITDTSGIIDYTRFEDNLVGFGRSTFPGNTYPDENQLEFNTITLTHWLNALNYLDGAVPNNANFFITNCLTDAARPRIDLNQIATLHLLLSQGVMEMRIQWAYTPSDLNGAVSGFSSGVRWWPSLDPNGDKNEADSDYSAMGTQFGAYFNLPNGEMIANWYPIQSCRTGVIYFQSTFYPKALKFTFTLRDSRGLFPDGKTFTHIVYLDN